MLKVYFFDKSYDCNEKIKKAFSALGHQVQGSRGLGAQQAPGD